MPLYEEKFISPFAIRFSQERIRPTFQDGHDLEETLAQVEAVDWPFDDGSNDVLLKVPFPSIEIIRWWPKMRDENGLSMVDEDGSTLLGEPCWFTFDNRRLYCLQHAASKVWPRRAAAVVHVMHDLPISRCTPRKFRTTDLGNSVRIARRYDVVPKAIWSWAEATGHNDAENPQGRSPEEQQALDHIQGYAVKDDFADLMDVPTGFNNRSNIPDTMPPGLSVYTTKKKPAGHDEEDDEEEQERNSLVRKQPPIKSKQQKQAEKRAERHAEKAAAAEAAKAAASTAAASTSLAAERAAAGISVKELSQRFDAAKQGGIPGLGDGLAGLPPGFEAQLAAAQASLAVGGLMPPGGLGGFNPYLNPYGAAAWDPFVMNQAAALAAASQSAAAISAARQAALAAAHRGYHTGASSSSAAATQRQKQTQQQQLHQKQKASQPSRDMVPVAQRPAPAVAPVPKARPMPPTSLAAGDRPPLAELDNPLLAASQTSASVPGAHGATGGFLLAKEAPSKPPGLGVFSSAGGVPPEQEEDGDCAQE
eukprot:TRINITY_DN18117_c0_g1_i1.p1 TRINITY_DN18117_c0_g1~~TRINITY_DN18117_c0_g1_i1.p1  ORF type:complete len:535 (+),score=133.97 TRINITY_DN18117_c0_g1_i1:74-1678(+)